MEVIVNSCYLVSGSVCGWRIGKPFCEVHQNEIIEHLDQIECNIDIYHISTFLSRACHMQHAFILWKQHVKCFYIGLWKIVLQLSGAFTIYITLYVTIKDSGKWDLIKSNSNFHLAIIVESYGLEVRALDFYSRDCMFKAHRDNIWHVVS